MPVRLVGTPETPLYRIGRAPDPLAWAPWSQIGEGRFDDPQSGLQRYRVLCAGGRRACFLETLARFRPSPFDKPRDVLSRKWLEARRIARFRIADAQRLGRWLDLRAPQTYETLKWVLAPLLRTQDFEDFDLSVATGRDLAVTQSVGEWAWDEGCDGIVYVSRFDPAQTCWAIFERPAMLPIVDVRIESIADDDPDFREVIDIFGLPEP